MADEELQPEEVAEDAAHVEDTAQEADPVEALAGELGWTPQDQWRGDPDKWRPAADFIRAGRDIQQTLSKELRSVKTEVERFGKVAADIAAQRAAERDEYWQNKHAQAVEDGDVEAARVAARELAKPAPAQDATPPEVSEWVSRNAWFNTDPLAQVRAKEISDQLARSGVTDVSQQLAQVERAIRREFPEHFKQPVKDPPATQTGQSRKAAPSNRAKGFADMPAESQQMARDMVRRNPAVTLEAIAKSYWEQEKVG